MLGSSVFSPLAKLASIGKALSQVGGNHCKRNLLSAGSPTYYIHHKRFFLFGMDIDWDSSSSLYLLAKLVFQMSEKATLGYPNEQGRIFASATKKCTINLNLIFLEGVG